MAQRFTRFQRAIHYKQAKVAVLIAQEVIATGMDLLTNGQRTIGEIASLLDIHPIDVAHMMKQLLAKGYVELLPTGDSP